jgi:hypothetical protein
MGEDASMRKEPTATELGEMKRLLTPTQPESLPF